MRCRRTDRVSGAHCFETNPPKKPGHADVAHRRPVTERNERWASCVSPTFYSTVSATDLLDMDNIANNPLLRVICSALFVIAAMAAHSGEIVEADPEEWLVEAEAAYDRVESYTALFHKQQRIAGELREEENIFLKFRKSHIPCT